MPYWAKVLAVIAVLVLNALMIFFGVLRAKQRGQSWQRGFCIACAVQLIAEIVLYETMECLWIHYFIPLTAGRGRVLCFSSVKLY